MIVIDTAWHPLATGCPPQWASAWGQDMYGVWVELTVGEAVQRLRWIPPGQFCMGSPEDEPDRSDGEGPQHEVILTQGFWLFDTATPQRLWEAVMGGDPSRFKGEDRPVEQVSWYDCQKFLTQINETVAGLNLTLPTEAQWEYACRAGTETAFSFGDNITPEQVNYDGNYPYAAGRKGRYREETVEVASLPPNAWGVHEMHGNVWEWCLDGRREYRAEAEVDPIGSTEEGAARVVRGGLWYDLARLARSAVRVDFDPGLRSAFLGFRCARVQE